MVEGAGLASSELVAYLVSLEDRPWPDHAYGRPLTAPQLARLLKPFKIAPTTLRLPGGGTMKGYYRSHFEAVWPSYSARTEARKEAAAPPGGAAALA